jgi:hypothetical protein
MAMKRYALKRDARQTCVSKKYRDGNSANVLIDNRREGGDVPPIRPTLSPEAARLVSDQSEQS